MRNRTTHHIWLFENIWSFDIKNKIFLRMHRRWIIRTIWKVSGFGSFLVRIFPHLDWMRKDTPYLSVFNTNTGKYELGKLRIRILFTHCRGVIQWWCDKDFLNFSCRSVASQNFRISWWCSSIKSANLAEIFCA